MSQKQEARVRSLGRIAVGMFRDQPAAEQAIRRLKSAGFAEDRIGVAMRDAGRRQTLRDDDRETLAAQGATTGAIGGGVVGGVIGLLAGVGALAIPGIGPVIAGGALVSTLGGAGIGAAAGGLIGALVGLGISEEDARRFELGVREGGVLVTVEGDERTEAARRILEESGADLGTMAKA